MKKINLIYWGAENFGDALSPMLVEELSGVAIQPKSWDSSRTARIKRVVGSLCKLRFSDLKKILWPSEHSLIAVGSVIRWGNSHSQIWGSGFMNTHETAVCGTVHAVRGRLTSQKLEEMGYPSCNVFGDPALLLPLCIPAEGVKKYKLGIVPHWTEVDTFAKRLENRYNIIDLRTKDIERTVREIFSCEYILSSSLHGLIVAHAYGIPALWIKEGYIATDGFKFKDYFSSVDIPFYEGFEGLDMIFSNEDSWMSLFENHPEKMIAQVDISQLQQNLLQAFPLPLHPNFQKYIKKNNPS